MAFEKGIAVAGSMVLDKLKVITAFPVRHELVKMLSVEDSCGGCVSNTGMDLAKLDESLKVYVVGLVGADADGQKLIDAYNACPNIDTSLLKRRGQTAFTDVLTEADSRARTFLFFGGSNDAFSIEDVDIERLDCDLFHIGYILLLKSLDAPDAEYGTKMARLLKAVQDRGILTSVDVVSETGDRYREIVPPALKYCDYFIVNEIESGKTVGLTLRGEDDGLLYEKIPEALRRLREMGVRRWAVIHAPEGAFAMDETGRYVEYESPKLPRGYIQGTVGAGDAFCAGVLYAAYQGESIETALAYGTAVAACSLSKPGATEGVPTIGQALKRLTQLKEGNLI